MDFSKIPFTLYDFLGYLASGILLFLGIPFPVPAISRNLNGMPVADWILFIIVVYILGHVLSSLSKLLYEVLIVDWRLKRPCDRLLSEARSKNYWISFLEYFHSFSKATTRIITKGENIPRDRRGRRDFQGLYEKALACVGRDKEASSRVGIFLSLYGFCRTISLTLLILGICYLVKGPKTALWTAGWVCLVLSIIMFLRYLKFYHQYSYELLIAYYGSKIAEAEAQGSKRSRASKKAEKD